MAQVVRIPGASSSAEPAPSAASIGKSHSRKKGKKSKRGDNITNPAMAKERQFYVEFGGRLMDMSSGAYMEEPLATAAALMHRPADSGPDAARIGDPKRAIVFSGRFNFVKNNFPVAMVLSSNVLRGRMYGAGRGDSYERGLLIVPPNTQLQFSHKDGGFLLPHAHLFDPQVQHYSKVAGRDLLAECSPSGVDEKLWCVKIDNPLIEVIQVYQREISKLYPNFSLDKAVIPTKTHVMVPWDILVKANERFNEVVMARMPHIDLTNMRLRLNRYGGDWTEPIIPTADQSINDALLSAHCTFSVGVTLAYRLTIDD